MFRSLQSLRVIRCRTMHTISCSNSLVNAKSEFLGGTQMEDGEPLRWYSCGPTVYDSSHLGHARTYICTDIIRRILSEFFRVPVHFALGITDVDDKIIMRAKEQGHSNWKGMREFAKQFEESYFNDMAALGIMRPHAILRVTDHMEDIESFVATLLAKGYAYEGPDGVWFDVRKIENSYGALGNVPPISSDEKNKNETDMEAGIGKRYPRDFSLWKAAKPGEPYYDSNILGAGRPGWHIECSAVVNSYFGPHIDIHSGGCDLRFPHHTNEIAQSEAFLDATGKRASPDKPWCGTWLHTGHLYIDGLKMSKSLKNFITIQDYLNGDYSAYPAEDFRIFCLQHRYHSSLHFNKDRIVQAAALRERVRGFLHRCEEALSKDHFKHYPNNQEEVETEMHRRANDLVKAILSTQYGVSKAFANDFDTPTALQHINTLIGGASEYLRFLESSSCYRPALTPLQEAADYVKMIFKMVGLDFSSTMKGFHTENAAYTDTDDRNDKAVMKAFVQFRSEVRTKALASLKSKDADAINLRDSLVAILKECDLQRDEVIPSLGYKVDDKSSGDTSLRRM